MNSILSSLEMLRRLSHKPSAPSYINGLRNTAIGVPGIGEDEKQTQFSSGSKPIIRLEALKSGQENVDNAPRAALNVDCALYSAGMLTAHRLAQGQSLWTLEKGKNVRSEKTGQISFVGVP